MRTLLVFLLGAALCAAAQDSGSQPAPAPSAPAEEKSAEAVTEDVLKGFEEYWAAEAVTPEEANAIALDVRQSVDMALAQNAQVQVAQDEVDAAQAKIGQAESARRPQVTAQSAYSYVPDLNMGSLGPLGSVFGSFIGDKLSRHDKVSATQVLYAGGQIQAAIQASQYLAQSQEWRKQATLNGLEFDAKKAYYDCLLARAIVRVAEESVVTFKRHLGDAQQMFDVGLISNFEVLRAKTEVGARETDLVAAKNATRLAQENLRRILAIAEDKPLRLVGKFEWTPVTDPVEDLLKEAYATRPELLALEKGIAAAEQGVKRAKGQYLPRVGATVDWSNAEGGSKIMPNGWTFGVGAELNLYAGGRRKHEVAESEAQKRNIEHQMEDVRRLIALDVRASHIQMEDAMARIQKEKGTVELAREGHRLAQLRFQEGVGTQTETLDADLALINAETALVKAVHDCAVAFASIEKARGKTWVKREEPAAK